MERALYHSTSPSRTHHAAASLRRVIPSFSRMLCTCRDAVAGAIVNWLLGRGVARFRDRRWFPLSDAQYARAEATFNRYGLWSLLFSWVPIIGDPLTLIAGALRVRFWPFLALVTLGKAARYVALAFGVALAMP